MSIRPYDKKTCDAILEHRRGNNGREPCRNRQDPVEDRLAKAKWKLKTRCEKAVGPYPSQRQLAPEEAAYFNWCLSAEAVEPGGAAGDSAAEVAQFVDESVAGTALGGSRASGSANDGAAGASALVGVVVIFLFKTAGPSQ